MNRQQMRAEIRAFDKEIRAFKSGRMTAHGRFIMDQRIKRLQAAGVIQKKKSLLDRCKDFFKRVLSVN